MDISITSDAWWETRLGESLNQFSLREINDFFYLKNYGDELQKIVICFLCCNPEHYGKLEQKVQFKRKEKILSIFFVLDYDLFIKINNTERETIVFNKIKDELPEIMKQKLSTKFNIENFKKDWLKAIQK